MRGFVIRENIKHCRRLLETTIDDKTRAQLHRLLAEEYRREQSLSACAEPGRREARGGGRSINNGASHEHHR